MTNLSILHLLQLEKAGKIARYKPTVASTGSGLRNLWMTPECLEWCCPSGGHPDTRITAESLVQLQDVLNAFALKKDLIKDIELKQLEPFDSEVWEFRSYAVMPYLRVFGSFVLPANFLAVVQRVRDDLEQRRGPKWDRAINETIRLRNQLLDGRLPATYAGFRQYLG